jgi:trimeric autotransporter adhesin
MSYYRNIEYVAVGSYSSCMLILSGNCNTAIRSSCSIAQTQHQTTQQSVLCALRNNTTGVQNTAIGFQTLRDNNTGTNNTAVGL